MRPQLAGGGAYDTRWHRRQVEGEEVHRHPGSLERPHAGGGGAISQFSGAVTQNIFLSFLYFLSVPSEAGFEPLNLGSRVNVLPTGRVMDTPGSTKANEREPKIFLGQAFYIELGIFLL